MVTMTALGRLVAALWERGSFITRATVMMILGWPLMAIMIAMVASHFNNPRLLIGVSAMIPVFAVIMAVYSFLNPMILVIIGAIPGGRVAVTYLTGVLLIEVLIGTYLSLVPTWYDIAMIPGVVLLMGSLAVLWLVPIPGARRIAGFLSIILLLITGVFFLGGSNEVSGKITKIMAPTPGKTYPTITLSCWSPTMQYVWEIKQAGGGRIYIPNTGCETPLVMAPNAQYFSFCPMGDLEVRREYEDGSVDPDFWELKPGVDYKPKAVVRGFQFRNRGPMEVTVYVTPGKCPL